MGLLDAFRRRRGEEMEHGAAALRAVPSDAKAGLAALPLPFLGDQPVFPELSYQGIADEAFRKNELAFSCIALLMRTFTEAPVAVMDANDEERPDAFVRQLLDRPNPHFSEGELFETYILHRRLAGNFFLEKVRSSAGRVVELWPLRPDRIRIIPDPSTFIGGYLYELGGQRHRLEPRDVIHLKAPNPLNDYFGMPDLRAGLRATALDNELTDMSKVHAQNRGVSPGTVITVGDEHVREEDAQRIRQRWRERFGKGGRGDVAVLPKGSTVDTVAMSLRELAFPDLRDVTEARICGALNVPPIMVGANVGLKRSTYANYDSARESLWFETIAPEQRKVAQKLGSDRDLAPDRGARVVFDSSRVHALRKLRNETFDRADRAVANGWLTINEARGLVGMKASDGGDVYLRALNTLPVPLESEEAEGRMRSADRQAAEEEAGQAAADQGVTLNGAQVQSLLLVLQNVSTGALTIDQAVSVLVSAFGIEEAAARKIVGRGGGSRPAISTEPPSGGGEQSSRRPPESKARTPEQAVAELRRAIGRTETALGFYDRLLEWAKSELEAEGREAVELIEEAGKAARSREVKALTPEQRDRIEGALQELAQRWGRRAAESIRPVLEGVIESAAESAAHEVGADFQESRAAIGAFVQEYSFRFAASVSETSADTIRSIVAEAADQALTVSEVRARVRERFDGNVDRAQRIARSETIRASNRGAEELYRQAGVERKRWVTAPDECPFCSQFDGRVVEVGAAFAEQGQTLDAEVEGRTRQMRLDYEAVPTPPLHPNCRCTIVAVLD